MSPYSSLNNTGIYDADFGSAKSSFVGVGYDNVSQVDRWLSNVEYNLDQTEQAVQKRATAASMTTTMSSLSLHPVASRSVAQAQDHTTATATSYNSRKYSAAQGARYGDIENVSAKTYYSGSGQQQKKKAIVRSATIGGSGSATGSLQRSQSLGRGQLASSLANLKARLGSRGSSRERMQQRFSANGVRSYSSAGGAHASVGLSKASRFSASRERASPLGMGEYKGEGGGGVTTSRANIAKAAMAGSERRKILLKRTVSDPTGQLCNYNGVARAKSPQKLRHKLRNQHPPAPPAQTYSSYDLSTASDVPGDVSGPEEPSGALCSCSTCNRTFNPKALEKHKKICEKVFKSKRPNSAPRTLGCPAWKTRRTPPTGFTRGTTRESRACGAPGEQPRAESLTMTGPSEPRPPPSPSGRSRASSSGRP